jgi:hypothetical protein
VQQAAAIQGFARGSCFFRHGFALHQTWLQSNTQL